MVLIFSENLDTSTNYVIDWLAFFNVSFLRDNGDDDPKLIDYDNEISLELDNVCSQVKIDLTNYKLNSKDINSIWFRRPYKGVDNLQETNLNFKIPDEIIHKNLFRYNYLFKEFLIHLLKKDCYSLGSFDKVSLNKGLVLRKAIDLNINIPKTLVSNSKSEVVKFLKDNGRIICKPLNEVVAYHEDQKTFMNYTKLISKEEEISENFSPSLFQEYVDKLYELRVYFINGEFFSMAIFSQGSDKTKIDFRNYDYENMNRMVPYNIEEELKIKLRYLMDSLELNTGSLDLIKSTNGNIYFLEVNPVGQYDFVSQNCNYNLDKKIAESFLKYEEVS